MLQKLAEILTKLNQPQEPQLTRNELQLASAALLVHAAHADGSVVEEETNAIRMILSDQYKLNENEIDELIEDAHAVEKQATDLYRFTRVLTTHLDQDGRKGIIKMLWTIILADGTIDNHEEHMIRKVADLIGVSTRDRILIRKQVEGRKVE